MHGLISHVPQAKVVPKHPRFPKHAAGRNSELSALIFAHTSRGLRYRIATEGSRSNQLSCFRTVSCLAQVTRT